MLENEPEGGERTGSQPAGDTAEQHNAPSSEQSSAGGTAPGAATGDVAGPGQRSGDGRG
ncbi:hypothetical protein [Micromonospora sp. NPDC049799]|uniref:hypothetical protein n=1 Tax=Micromonospora sp. NPDC049799 TaxID=3154741 RepID=UPI0033DE230E